VCDHRGLALAMGAVGNAGLGEVLAGLKPGRTRPDELTVRICEGLPFTNLAAAWSVYPAAREDTELQRLDFHS
jgi:ornithine cyclodeaminase